MTTTSVTRAPAREVIPRLEWQLGIDAICASHAIPLAQLQSPLRFKAHCAARRECYAFLQARGWSTPRIGKFFHRDSTTVCLALASDERRAVRSDRARALVLLRRDAG